MPEETITLVHQRWTQMLQYGREKKFMTVKFMEKKNTCKMLLIFKLMVINKKLLPIPDYHTHLILKQLVNNQPNPHQQQKSKQLLLKQKH